MKGGLLLHEKNSNKRVKGNDMKSGHIISRPMSVSEVKFQDFYEQMSEDWQSKAERLQARRRRAMRRAVKSRNFWKDHPFA